MIPVPVVDGYGVIYDVEHVKILREQFNISGVLTGVLQQFPQQNVFQGLPLQLLPEDTRYLLEKGAIYLVNDQEAHLALPPVEKDPVGELVHVPTATSPLPEPTSGINGEPIVRAPRERGYAIYKYLMERGFFILPGLRFGCQYMAYPGDMMRYHSHFNVNGYGWDEPFPVLDIVSGGRLGTSVKKCWVVGSQPPDPAQEARVFSVEWAGFG